MLGYRFIESDLDIDVNSAFTKVAVFLYPSHQLPRIHQLATEHLVKCVVLLYKEEPIGRYALYANATYNFEGKTALSIGCYECIEDEKASTLLLNHAATQAMQGGASHLIGPMSGSTWQDHRFGIGDDDTTYFMEAVHKPYYVGQFSRAGFESISNYTSYLVNHLEPPKGKLLQFESYFHKKGAVIRNIDIKQFEAECLALGKFSNEAFINNYLFSPLDPIAFAAKYTKLIHYMDASFVTLVEDSSRCLQAFLFAIHDHTDTSGKTLIVKSIANRPKGKFKGISTYLYYKLLQIAKSRGYQRIINAYIHEANSSNTTSSRVGTPLKHYRLYARQVIKDKK